MRTKWFVLLVAAFAALALWGCGSNGGSGGSDVGEPGDVDTVGISNCSVCHEVAVKTFVDALDTPASNGMNERSNAHGNANGRPPLTYYGNDAGDCSGCHDPAGDGTTLFEKFGASSERPVPGCESCHGGGSAHRGVGPIPYPNPDIERCADCHNAHGNNIDTLQGDYNLTSHATHSHGSSAKCQRCHTHEGALAFGDDATGNKAVMDALADPALTETGPMVCATCHDEHYFGFRIPLDWSFDGDPQFDLCTSCHTLLDPTIGDAWVRENSYHTTSASRTIADTHYDDPATLGTDVIEGYAVRNNDDNPCSDCHDVHATDRVLDNGEENPDEDDGNNPIEYNLQWANSAHAGFIGEVKESATDIFAEGVTDAIAPGWAHYDWDSMAGGRNGNGRQDCQRCHTATGTVNYMDDPANYDPSTNDFSHLVDWPTGTDQSSPQNELLYCWGCHDSVTTGKLNNPGGVLEDYSTRDSTYEVTVQYPDIINSNTCMTCHLGREIGEVVQSSGDDFNDTSFINSHYLAAGASIFAVSGFEYPEMNYTNVAFYAHDSIGTEYEVITEGADIPLTDNASGPCASCHLSSEMGHRFLPYEIDDQGTTSPDDDTFEYITDVCAECHSGGFALTPQVIEEEVAGYEASLEVLNQALIAQGYTFLGGYPYFSAKDWIPVGQDQTDQQIGKNTMGAAFNYNLAIHEPGGFAHNRFYYKRLSWDSIDWMDDFILNNSVPTTISSLETGGAISAEVSAAASAYLGTVRPGTGIDDRAPIPGLDPITSY
jgi:hypothetical protein